MNGMIGPGAGLAQNARAAPGIGEPAPHGLGKIRRTDIMRARREEQDAARRGQLRGEPRQLAVAAQRRPTSRFKRAKGGGSAMTMSKRSPDAERAAASANTSARRKVQRSATSLRRDALSASARAGSERSMPSTEAAPARAAATANPPL